jgi:hypothetical protein
VDDDDRDLFGPPEGPAPAPPTGPTEPIRPRPPANEPIPERVRQPIVVPHQVSTLGGLPRPLAIGAVIVIGIVFLVGFLIGQAIGGDDDEPAAVAAAGRRGACTRALTLTLDVIQLQRQAIVNRTTATQAIALGDDGRVEELNLELAQLSPVIQEAESKVTAAVERCRGGAGGGGGKGNRGGKDNAGKQGSNA